MATHPSQHLDEWLKNNGRTNIRFISLFAIKGKKGIKGKMYKKGIHHTLNVEPNHVEFTK